MNSKNTLFWAALAAALFVFIFFFERHFRQPETGPGKILSGLNFSQINSLSIRIGNQSEIRVERTNQNWLITQPVLYPAETTNVDGLLRALSELTSAAPPITAAELKQRPKADEEFGFASPQASLILRRGEASSQVLLGARTAPGDQVFLRVVGVEDVFIVDAQLLSFIPRTEDDWRDRNFANLGGRMVDHITVMNGTKVFELQREATNQLWRITRPQSSRADNAKIQELLARLPSLRVIQFCSDDSHADLESFGLQPPDWEMSFASGTNILLDLQFGKNPTTNAAQFYARRADGNSVVVVNGEALGAWRSSFESFRDHNLIALPQWLSAIEVDATDGFSMARQTNNTWLVQPQNFPADSNLMAEFLGNISTLQITQFVKDVVTDTDPDLASKYGLVPPSRRFTFKAAAASNPTNLTFVQLDFGATNDERIFTRRSDEDSVYAVSLADFQRLPANSWLLRDRRIWKFNGDDVVAITIRQSGRERRLLHPAPFKWSLAPGSEGAIDIVPLEQVTPRFGDLTAAVWVDRGEQNRAKYGFKENGHQITFELKDGRKFTVEFGGEAPSQFPYAAVKQDDETWIFEFPWDLYQYVLMYYTVPLTWH